MAVPGDAEATAIQMLAARNLHQSLWLPETASHGRRRVTFSTTSNFDDERLPVILFVGPMFGTRYLALMLDKLACSHGLRVICTDRPALGGASAVPVGQRIDTWLETVPVLLRHLHVRHVHLITHSAGAPYTLNTLVKLRDVLDPRAPYVAFLAPWVHPDDSHTIWKAASALPVGVISHLSDLTEFFQQTVMPATSWSGGIISSFSSIFQAAPGSAAADEGEGEYQDKYGVEEETGKALETLQSKYAFAEGMQGAGEEVVLCLKKAGEGAWGACENYMACAQVIAMREQERQDSIAAKLRVRLHFAGSDVIIGKGGRDYFTRCWRQGSIAEAVDVECTDWPEANHDTLLVDFRYGAMHAIFKEIQRISSNGSSTGSD